jgi:hypothetical protein
MACLSPAVIDSRMPIIFRAGRQEFRPPTVVFSALA